MILAFFLKLLFFPDKLVMLYYYHIIYYYCNKIGSQALAYLTQLSCVYWLGAVITSPTDIFLGSAGGLCTLSPSAKLTVPNAAPSISPSAIFTVNPTIGPSVKPTSCSPTAVDTTNNCCVGDLSIATTVTSIAAFAYNSGSPSNDGCLTITSVSVPSTVTFIGFLLIIMF